MVEAVMGLVGVRGHRQIETIVGDLKAGSLRFPLLTQTSGQSERSACQVPSARGGSRPW